jgi:Cu/Ag efflux protein CusF
MRRKLYLLLSLATLMLSAFGVSATQPAVSVADSAVAVATVVAIDEQTRDITLAGPEGDRWTFTAGPEVRNFDQIKRGDRVIASYFAGFALALGPQGSGVKARYDTLTGSRAKPGERPAATFTRTTEATGVVKAIDAEKRLLTLQGVEKTIVLRASADIDISQVRVGDEVEAIFVESYAINVEPAPEVSGTVTLQGTAVAAGVGFSWGDGTLTLHDGSTHKFKISGLSLVDVGFTKINATGEVFNLVEAKELSGNYVAGAAGATFIGGGSVAALKNENGVVMQLKSSQKGLRLTLAPAGLNIKLVE